MPRVGLLQSLKVDEISLSLINTATTLRTTIYYRLFADDLKIYARMSNDVVVTVVQNALDRLVEWSDLWQLQISITKCNSMYVGRHLPCSIDLKIRDLSLPVVNSCRDLGILVCSALSHSSHIANIVNAASQRSNLILLTFVSCNSQHCHLEICICYVC